MKKIELRPCPFCGKRDKLEITPPERYCAMVAEDQKGFARISVRCWTCNCEKTVYNWETKNRDYDSLLSAMVDAWNTREGGPHA